MESIIAKNQSEYNGVTANLADYEQAYREFDWERARQELSGLPGGGLNIAYEAVDRHALGERRDHIALRWLGRNGAVCDYSYAELKSLTDRFANILRSLGIGKGDAVFALCGRVPELYIAALGSLKNGSLFCPLFAAFGPEPIAARLRLGAAKVLVTTEALYQRKVAGMREALPELREILVIGDNGTPPANAEVRDLKAMLAAADPHCEIEATAPEDPALLHFTSGTTGSPKGAVHVHAAGLVHYVTGRLVLDLHPEDIFWCTADPGWVTGTSYGIFAPLINGVTNIIDEGEFDALRWYRILQEQRVTVWYTAPTAIRMLMKAGSERARAFDLSHLRFAASVGEPLDPESVIWGQQALGRAFHDTWWQSETGGIMIANYATMPIKPGSMGRPLPGVEAAILRRYDDGHVEQVTQAEVEGELALRSGWPSMFRAYWNDPERYQRCFADGWYLSGDLAKRDADGYFWFVGRADDMIKSAGHLIGPFEVESALLAHPCVAEAGVIGKPDEVAREVVKAFVVLRSGFSPTDVLRRDILSHARKRLGAAVAPREIEFRDNLPKTRSGKILRRLLKAEELGLPKGDLSILENGTPESK